MSRTERITTRGGGVQVVRSVEDSTRSAFETSWLFNLLRNCARLSALLGQH